MIRFCIILGLIVFFGCSAITNLVVGASGNIFSDSVGKALDKKNNTDCKGQE
jgi:hypothetical protein